MRGQGAEWWQSWGYPFTPDLVDGSWFNLQGGLDPYGGCGSCLVWDSARRIPQIDLGQYPVTSAAVTIDGVPLAGASYRIDNWHLLTRIDGNLWPIPNLLGQPGPGTWTVDIGYGLAPPQPGVTACAVLAAELTKHCLGDQKCALPLRVTNVSRQGVSYSLANVMDILNKGRTGLYMVDLFLATYNPQGLDHPARVLSPDLQGPRRLGSL
jgi:hypothetical protein